MGADCSVAAETLNKGQTSGFGISSSIIKEFGAVMTEFGSSVESLKVIVSLLMSLAIANSFIIFVGSAAETPTIGDSFSIPDPHTLILFPLCILTNIRFLHGNYRHLDPTGESQI
jgi:hypothetical protein